MFDRAIYDTVIAVMLILAVVVFFALQYITAGYGTVSYTHLTLPTSARV